jgi:hypothetical protein
VFVAVPESRTADFQDPSRISIGLADLVGAVGWASARTRWPTDLKEWVRRFKAAESVDGARCSRNGGPTLEPNIARLGLLTMQRIAPPYNMQIEKSGRYNPDNQLSRQYRVVAF